MQAIELKQMLLSKQGEAGLKVIQSLLLQLQPCDDSTGIYSMPENANLNYQEGDYSDACSIVSSIIQFSLSE